mmetsp:Transcript_13974/g.44743  ORF Transcript_13974/g.44743 Transcript_13974/m.44743 type:complete len:210 (-) Transcript_13974:139-768(-)
MALNVPLFNQMTPMSKAGEFYLCERPKLSFELTSPGMPALRAKKGTLFVTTQRLVFVPQPAVRLRDGATFSSFEMPLADISGEKFNQPIFGANNLTGTVKPSTGMGLTYESKFKLTFGHGGAGTFLPLFFRALYELRDPASAAAAGTLSQAVMSGTFSTVVVSDPNDPSIIYVTQPDIPVASASSADSSDVPVAQADSSTLGKSGAKAI